MDLPRCDTDRTGAAGPSLRAELAAAAWFLAFGALVVGLVAVYVVGITTVARWVLQGA